MSSKWIGVVQVASLLGVALVSQSQGYGQATKSVRVWNDSTIPGTLDDGAELSTELGMRFRSDVAGSVTGVRFYKSLGNVGTHTGSLWSNTGALLATVTFTNETASGWQTALFSTPVPITANTTYIVSYYVPVGHFALDSNYFTTTNGGIYNAPLRALATGVDGANGVYRVGPGFPDVSLQTRNYWVDPIVSVPDTGSTTAVPGAVVRETGTLITGTQAGLAFDENTFYRLNSTTSGTRTSSWYGSFTNVPNETPQLTVAYKGKNSRSCTEVVSIYNWTTLAWVSLASQAVTTTEVLRSGLSPAGTMADFVSGTSGAGEVRVRVSCTTTANFSTSADLLTLTWAPTVARMTMTYPTPGVSFVGNSFTATYITTGDLVASGVGHAHLYLDSNPVVMDIPMDGSRAFASVAPGAHTIRGILARGDHSEIAGSESTIISFVTSMPDLTPPSVSVTAPGEGALVSGTVVASADAADNLGVAGVQFLLDGGTLGTEDTTSPYSISFNASALSVGAHVITARARDISGNNTLSAPRNIVVADSTAPSVSMTSPAAGASIFGNTTATADATDNIAVVGVQFRLDGNPLGAEDLAAPYATTFDASAFSIGAHSLTAAARDAAGNVTVSAPRSVTVTAPPDTTFPTISLTAPADGASVSGNMTATADAADNVAVVGVQFRVDGNPVGAEDLSAPFAVTFDANTFSNGAHVLTAAARDAAGNVTVSTPRSVTVSAPPDTTFPSITMTAPAQGASVSGNVTATADATDNVAVVGVQFLMDGSPLGAEDLAAPYAITFDANSFPNGAHVLTASARDAAGNVTVSAARNVTVTDVPDTTFPSVSMTAPAQGASVYGNITATADATDNIAVVGVQFRMDGNPLGAEDLSSPFTVTFDANTFSNGAHVLTAAARDGAGNVTVSAARNITVTAPPDTTFPSVTMTAPAQGASVHGNTTATADATDNVAVVGVQFFMDGTPVGAEDLAAPYAVTFDANTFTNGAHVLTAAARDAAGNVTASAARNITVTAAPDTTFPTISMTAPAQGASITGNTTATADAADNVAVVGVQFRMDGNPVGAEDLTAPYAVTFDAATFPAGAHILTAAARDAAGNVTVSAARNVTVADTTSPTISITAPAEGASVSSTTVASATASDNVGVVGVQFQMDGNPLGAEDLTAPYSLSFNANTFSNGAHALTAAARDAAGNITVSAARNITVTAPPDTTFPSVTMTAPAQGATVTGNVTATADASDNVGVAGVQFRMDGNALGAEDLVAPYAATFDAATLTAGAHVLTAAARDAAGNITVSASRNITVADTTFPTISLTAPAQGAAVTGNVAATATASDNVAVVGVQFLLDGANLGTEDTTAPYSITWNSGLYSSGAHTISARARDAAGNSTVSATRNITISNATDPAVIGQWSGSINWPFVAVHMVLLNTGKVLVYEGTGLDAQGLPGGVFDPTNGSSLQIADPMSDLFCTSHSVLPDGRVLVVGGHGYDGHLGIRDVNIFNPATQSWSTGPSMAYRRWYPTSTNLPDGRVLVTSGSDLTYGDNIPIPEIYNPVTNTWTTLTTASHAMPPYPHIFVLADGKIAYTGSDEGMTGAHKLDLNTLSWSAVDPGIRDGGSSVMYEDGKFMKSGSAPWDANAPAVSANTTYVIDYNSPNPAWQQTGNLNNARGYHIMNLLPDGNVIVTNGARNSDQTQPVRMAEMWSPVTKTWTALSNSAVDRTYHANAILLPDARLLVAGSGRAPGMVDQRNYELYSPAYLFKGARPTISSVPSLVNYTSSFFVGTPDGATVTSAVLMRPGAVTHQIDMEQRRVPLTFTQTAGGLTVTAPANSNLAPPGYYMLFLLNANGVPSVAKFLRLPAPYEDTVAPSAPGAPSALGAIGTVSLTWTPSTDNNGVALYNVHRSTVSGFTPATANRIAQVAGTSYTDSGLAAGLYYYKITAQDANGNVSAPSGQGAASVTSDVTGPSVTLTAPSVGASLSGTVTVSANASDDVAVAGVQFLLDGAPLLAEDTSAPYSISWNTLATSNGTHQLAARARDTGGNLTTTANLSITVANASLTGAVAVYGFEEAGGVTTVSDSSGNNNTGSIATATRVLGKYGNGLHFNGYNSIVTVPASPSLNPTSGVTVMAWLNPEMQTSWIIAAMKEGATETWTLLANDNNSRPRAGVRAGGDLVGISAPGVLPVNTWTHIALTYNGATFAIYVNGVMANSMAATGALSSSTNPFVIGGSAVWGEYFTGVIDEVRVYNRGLTQSEVQSAMNTPAP